MTTRVVSGGDKVAAYLAELSNRFKERVTLRVGFLQGATYPDGTPVAMVAAIQDFGAPRAGIPPRPFFRDMIDEKSSGWPATLAEQLRLTGYDVDVSLNRLGAEIAGQLRQSIVDFEGAPLKPATIARKGSSKQLVDTGHMLDRVDFELRKS